MILNSDPAASSGQWKLSFDSGLNASSSVAKCAADLF